MNSHRYSGLRAVLTTMHGKGSVIVPALQSLVGLAVEINSEIDTDRLGTFTNEITRKGDMLETAIEKARLGMAAGQCKIGIASEGSFSPHPVVPFLAINRELLVFVDDASGLIIKEMIASEDTNFSSIVIKTGEDISGFLDRAQFPSHAVAVSPNQSVVTIPGFKGIVDRSALGPLLDQCACVSTDGAALLQTDMCANFNPSRMKVIESCAHRLSQRILSVCPQCGEAGWGIVDVERGLPCEFCGDATNLINFEIWGCVRCDYRETLRRGDGITRSQQMLCPSCNP